MPRLPLRHNFHARAVLGALILSGAPAPEGFCTEETTPDSKSRWVFLDNGELRIGVDTSRGACIGFFGESDTRRNLLNNYDEGRYIQQSYYGAEDGSDWNGKPWCYNPVQGGDWRGNKARVLELTKDRDNSLRAKIEPLSWASGRKCPEAIMTLDLSLHGKIARAIFKMDYTGEDQGPARHQEMPAVFVDAELSQLVYPSLGTLTRRVPSWPNEYGKSDASWFAYLDENDWGIGICTPGTTDFTCYRFAGNGVKGPLGSSCSYIAPLRTFALKSGLTVSYECYLTIGSLGQIKQRVKSVTRSYHLQKPPKFQSPAADSPRPQ